MNPMVASLAGLATVLVGACAMLLMLEQRGNPGEDKEAGQRLIKAHRTSGWLLIVLCAAIEAAMLFKAGSHHEEFSPRVLLHVALGLLLPALLAIKLLIVRRFKRLGTMVPGLGLAAMLVLFLLNGLTGGYYLLHRSDLGHVSVADADAWMLDPDLGQRLTATKCGKCHSLERVFRSFKSEQGWTATVSRMAAMDAPNIRSFDAKQIIHYLIGQQRQRKNAVGSSMGKVLVEQKCAACHPLDRVHAVRKSQEAWQETVERMARHADDPNFLGPEEQELIVRFLTARNGDESRNDGGR